MGIFILFMYSTNSYVGDSWWHLEHILSFHDTISHLDISTILSLSVRSMQACLSHRVQTNYDKNMPEYLIMAWFCCLDHSQSMYPYEWHTVSWYDPVCHFSYRWGSAIIRLVGLAFSTTYKWRNGQTHAFYLFVGHCDVWLLMTHKTHVEGL